MDHRTAILAELPRLRRYARALVRDAAVADDLVQDCVERALSRLALFRDGSNMAGWLLTIMHNIHVNGVRRAARTPLRVALEEDGVRAPVVPANQPGSLAVRDLERALAQLPDDQRHVLLLVGLESLSYKEAASVLDVPVGTVMSRLSRGREQLRHLMDGGVADGVRRVK